VRPPQTETSPLPGVDARTEAYWAALARGELLLQACEVCGARSHPAAVECRVCTSARLAWSSVEPSGTLFSWAVEQRAVISGMQPPYVIAQVTPGGCLPGEVRLVGTLLVDDPATLEIGMPVRLVSARAPGSTIALGHFAPA
jgi:uncharacterized OB-fold protein